MSDTKQYCDNCAFSIRSGEDLLCAVEGGSKMLSYTEKNETCKEFRQDPCPYDESENMGAIE